MTKEELKKLRDDLISEKEEIESEIRSIASENPLVKGDFDVKIDDLGESMEDAAQELSELDRNQAMVAALEKRLKDISHAIEKIDSGSYGKCENCSDKIEPSRLKAMPVASLCISCAKKGEN
jgi:RNA polymerase-binding transcription factor DksA